MLAETNKSMVTTVRDETFVPTRSDFITMMIEINVLFATDRNFLARLGSVIQEFRMHLQRRCMLDENSLQGLE